MKAFQAGKWFLMIGLIFALAACSGGGGGGGGGAVSKLPTADAGADQAVTGGENVTLTGSGSTAVDGTITSYAWTQTEGPTVVLNSPATSQPTFIAPTVTQTTALVFKLTVTDDKGAKGIDLVQITVSNQAGTNQTPIANAGTDQDAVRNQDVTLDGSGSSDSDGTIVSYAWTQIQGPTVTLSSASTVNPSFTAPVVSSATTLAFQLTVTDDEGATGVDAVQILVSYQPDTMADAGTDQVVTVGQNVTLDGSGSNSVSGTITSYAWTQTEGPTVVLNSYATSQPTFTVPTVTQTTALVFKLTVTDDTGATASDLVQITVSYQASSNQPPIANAGTDQSVVIGQDVTLDGSLSSDADGTITSYAWTQTDGTTVVLTGASTVNPAFPAPEVTSSTTLAFQLTVTDDDGATHVDSVQIVVSPPKYNLTAYTIKAQKPSIVTMVQRVTDRTTGAPVTNLKTADFQVLEDGASIAARESFLDLEPIEDIPYQMKTVLVIDISSSLTSSDLTQVKTAALNIVSRLSPGQQMAVYTFDDVIKKVIDFSSDAAALTSAINGITLGGPSTNLYGAVVKGLGLWSNDFSLDSITHGSLILITDGNDTASLSTLDAAIAAKGNRDLFALSVGSAVNNDILVQLALGKKIGTVSQTDRDLAAPRLFAVNDYSQVNAALQEIAAEVENLTQGIYILYYATPKRAGTHTVTVSISNNALCISGEASCATTLEGTFDATGFSSVSPELQLSQPGQWLTAGQSYQLSARVRWANGPFTYNWSLTNTDGKMSLTVDPTDPSKATLTVAVGTLLSEGSVTVGVPEVSLEKALPFNVGIPVSDDQGDLAPGGTIGLGVTRPEAVLTVGITCSQCTWSVSDASVATLSATTGQSVTLQRGTSEGTATLTVADPTSGHSTNYSVAVTFGPSPAAELALGMAHSCALDGGAVICWGSNSYGQTTVPALTNPTQVAAGDYHTCALDDTGVKCWGSNSSGQRTVPVLTNPTQIAAGSSNTCALDDTGVKCWGSKSKGQTTVPEFTNPAHVAVGNGHICALDDTGVKCWGNNVRGQTTVPALTNPTQVSAGGMNTCAVDDTGLQCWGDNDSGQTTVPALTNPTEVSAGGNHTCALDDTGVKCWGYNGDGQTTVPALTNPTEVEAGGGHTCAVDDTGVVCWGRKTFGATVPE